MLADFILLNRDPLDCPIPEIKDIRVEKTFVDGNCVWETKANDQGGGAGNKTA
jgi:predicted amidohydrolase YtcJ